jgi:hypothetical protein
MPEGLREYASAETLDLALFLIAALADIPLTCDFQTTIVEEPPRTEREKEKGSTWHLCIDEDLARRYTTSMENVSNAVRDFKAGWVAANRLRDFCEAYDEAKSEDRAHEKLHKLIASYNCCRGDRPEGTTKGGWKMSVYYKGLHLCDICGRPLHSLDDEDEDVVLERLGLMREGKVVVPRRRR